MPQGTISGALVGSFVIAASFAFVSLVLSGQFGFPQLALNWAYIVAPVAIVYLWKYVYTVYMAIKLQHGNCGCSVRTWEVVAYTAVASMPPLMDWAYGRAHLLNLIFAVISPTLATLGARTEVALTRNTTVYHDTIAYGIGGCSDATDVVGCFMTSNELLVNQTRAVLNGKPFSFLYTAQNGQRYMPLWPLIPGVTDKEGLVPVDKTAYVELKDVPGGVFDANCSYQEWDRNPFKNSSMWTGSKGEIELYVNGSASDYEYDKVLNITIPNGESTTVFSCQAHIEFWHMDATWLISNGSIRLMEVKNKHSQIKETFSRFNGNFNELKLTYSNTFRYYWRYKGMSILERNKTVPGLFDAHIQTLIMRAAFRNNSLFKPQVQPKARFTYVDTLHQPGQAVTYALLATAVVAAMATITWVCVFFCWRGRRRNAKSLMFDGNTLQLLKLFKKDPGLLDNPWQALRTEDHGQRGDINKANVHLVKRQGRRSDTESEGGEPSAEEKGASGGSGGTVGVSSGNAAGGTSLGDGGGRAVHGLFDDPIGVGVKVARGTSHGAEAADIGSYTPGRNAAQGNALNTSDLSDEASGTGYGGGMSQSKDNSYQGKIFHGADSGNPHSLWTDGGNVHSNLNGDGNAHIIFGEGSNHNSSGVHGSAHGVGRPAYGAGHALEKDHAIYSKSAPACVDDSSNVHDQSVAHATGHIVSKSGYGGWDRTSHRTPAAAGFGAGSGDHNNPMHFGPALRYGPDYIRSAAIAVGDGTSHDRLATAFSHGTKYSQSAATTLDDGSNQSRSPIGFNDGTNQSRSPIGFNDGTNQSRSPIAVNDGTNQSRSPIGFNDGTNQNRSPIGFNDGTNQSRLPIGFNDGTNHNHSAAIAMSHGSNLNSHSSMAADGSNDMFGTSAPHMDICLAGIIESSEATSSMSASCGRWRGGAYKGDAGSSYGGATPG